MPVGPLFLGGLDAFFIPAIKPLVESFVTLRITWRCLWGGGILFHDIIRMSGAGWGGGLGPPGTLLRRRGRLRQVAEGAHHAAVRLWAHALILHFLFRTPGLRKVGGGKEKGHAEGLGSRLGNANEIILCRGML